MARIAIRITAMGIGSRQHPIPTKTKSPDRPSTTKFPPFAKHHKWPNIQRDSTSPTPTSSNSSTTNSKARTATSAIKVPRASMSSSRDHWAETFTLSNLPANASKSSRGSNISRKNMVLSRSTCKTYGRRKAKSKFGSLPIHFPTKK